jgi:magnesium transporter
MTTTEQADGRLRAYAFQPGQGIHDHVDVEKVSDLLATDSLVWLDVTDPQPEDVAMLQSELGLHPLGLEEMTYSHPRPKCLEFRESYVLVMYAVGRDSAKQLALREVTIFVGRNFLVTAHRGPFPEIDECIKRWRDGSGIPVENIAAPLYSLLDTLVDGYFPLVDSMAEQYEEMEDRIFEGNGSSHGSELFERKKEMLTLRRILSAERDALNQLLRQDIRIFPEGAIVYYQSVYDHLVRLVETVDTYRDLLSSAMDMHLSVISNRMNQVMKTLTVVSTILMSASLIAGIYGMNFQTMPELHWRYGYFGALGLMGFVAFLLYLVFRRLKWV